MGLSRSTRIIILLAIDTVFFFLEISVGFATHSLALVADSFHMLNDVFSLLVALWAIKLARAKSTNDYTYGWQRAEVLGALINAVFLLALCFSIFLEAIQRFFEAQIINNPRLVLVVGSAGLASNIIGLFLFHDHGHGDHGHSHGGDIESGHEHGHSHAEAVEDDAEDTDDLRSDRGDIESILPTSYVRRISSPVPPTRPRPRRNTTQSRQQRFASPVTDIHVHPALNRQEILTTAESSSSSSHSEPVSPATETTPLFPGTTPHQKPRRSSATWHFNHNHTRPKPPAKSQRSLNMQGVFLHVLGDALGNVGVIATALYLIFLPQTWFAPYADPTISLVITVIICTSALPLVKSASKILLQGVPKGIALDEVKEDIASIPGIVSVHELHIWQLSDVKMIASLHIQIGFDPERGGGGEYMRLAKAVRTCLHAVGVHSVTIQPEYVRVGEGAAGEGYGAIGDGDAEERCVLECGEECGKGKCCAPVSEEDVGHGGHGHAH